MKKTIIFFAFSALFFFPNFSYAATCSSNGSSIVYINGIFTSEKEAQDDLKEIKREYKNKTKNEDVYFLNGYNESHIAGLGDIIKVLSQMQKGNASLDYDLTNILRQVNEELSTRKVLLVGHSQGTFYTNEAYKYLIWSGVPRESIAVYNIATPANKVEGNGRYLTSETDKVIRAVAADLAYQGFAKMPLPPNIYIPLNRKESAAKYGGHSLSEVYLKNAPDRIVGDMKKALDNLSVFSFNFYQPPLGGCFFAPEITASYYVKKASFFVGDGTGFIGNKIKTGAAKVKDVAVFVSDKIYGVAEYIFWETIRIIKENPKILLATVQTDFNQFPASPTENLATQNQAASAEDQNLARLNLVKFAEPGEPIQYSIQDQIDDILEKIDILQRKIADIKVAENPTNLTEPIDARSSLNLDSNNENDDLEKNQNNNQNSQNNVSASGQATYYGKILISEIQIGGINDSKEEFVELYNMETREIDLTDWYLQRKTKTGSSYSSFTPNTLFAGKKIAANGYFLIARQGYFSGLGDIFNDNSLTGDNTLVLKNPSGEISDKVGWGSAQDYELIATQNPLQGLNQSIGRKILSNEPTDTNVNLMDFEFGKPTPKTKNIAYTPSPEPPTSPEPKDITAPEIIFSIAAIQEQLSFTVDFEIIDPLGTVSPSGIANYTFRWKEESGGWNEDTIQQVNDSPYSFDSKKDFSGADEMTYYFQIKAEDAEGNESDWLPETPAETKIGIFKKILINEIQTDGITSKDEFIELYNPNTVDINLEEFALKKKTSGGAESNLVSSGGFSGIIKSLGYFLIAPQDNDDNGSKNYTGLAEPDLRYSGKSYSIAKNNTILLYNKNGTLLDKVGFGEANDFETTSTINPEKNKSIERKTIGGDTDNNSADFKVSENPTPKESFMQVSIKDITNYYSNFDSRNEANFYRLSLEWSSQTPDIVSYDTQYKINDGNWKNWLENTTDTKNDFIAYYSVLIVKNVYSFRARSKDTNGSISDWTQIDIDLSAPVVINEIALFGTNANREDVWIEFYNKSDKDIDLAGWYWKSTDSRIPISGTIPANGYFLLEKKDDDCISNLPTNQLFEETLIARGLTGLFDDNDRLVDYFPVLSNGWREHHFKQGNNFSSLERISPYAEGSREQNWKINNGIAINGTDRNGNPIFGTPKQQNSNYQIYTLLPMGFGIDAILPKNLSPYLIVSETSISENATVAVEQGSVVKFYNSALTALIINGTLSAIGTETEKIIFTSFADDSYGGDSNSDNSESAPAPGNWLGLQFTETSKNSELENIIVRYGGATIGFSPPNWGQAIWVKQSIVSLKNSLFEKNLNRAVVLDNSDSIIDSVKFIDNNTTNYDTDDTQARAVSVKGGKPFIKNSYFENNRIGIYTTSFFDELKQIEIESFPIIENNYFAKNTNPIYWIGLATPYFSGNIAEDNDFNAIVFLGATSRNIILKPDLPYLIRHSTTVPENIALIIEPGVILAFLHDGGLEINGTLKAVGTPDHPILFGPYIRDNEPPLLGSWRGLQFTKTSKNSELENVEIYYGGAITGESPNATIKVEQSVISLKNSVLRQNANTGVWLVNSPSVIDSVQFLEHKEKTSSVDARAIFVEGGIPEIRNSFFKDNYYGIYIDNWFDEEAGENIFGTPILENNQFEDSIEADIYMLPSPL